MAFTRIKDSDLAGKGVKDQSTVPGLSAEEMKASVEQIVREVAIPGVNRLVDELGDESAAGNIGMPVPSTMQPETGATVGEIVTAHIENEENPHAVTAAQVGAYTKEETDDAIDQKVQAIGAADMSKAEFATNGEYGVVDKAKAADTASAANDGVKVYSHTRSGTVNELTGTGPNGRALMTANVQEGDTWTVNGQPVTAYMGAEDATGSMAGSAYNGKWVSFIVEGETLNFKGGGGKVTVSGLAANKILKGTTVTVKQGAKTVTSVNGSAPVFYGWIAGGGTDDNGSFVACDIPGVTVTRVSDSTTIPNPGSKTYSAGRNETTIKCNKSFKAVCYTMGGPYPPQYNGSNLSNGQTFSYVAGKSIQLNGLNNACVIRVTSIPE